MAVISTILGKIKVKETVEQIFDKFNSEIYVELTEIISAEKMNGDIVRHENKIFILRESIITITH